MICPDCADVCKKLGTFYTCQRCGLSFKPWEVEEARKRAKDEIKALKVDNEEDQKAKKKKDRIRYRNWFEGRRDIDD